MHSPPWPSTSASHSSHHLKPLQNSLEILGRTLTFFALDLFLIHFHKLFVRGDLEEWLSLLDDSSIATFHDDLVDRSGEGRPDGVEHLHDFNDVERLACFEMHPFGDKMRQTGC